MRRNQNHNESGIFNARKGYYIGYLCLFTHKDISKGEVFLDTMWDKNGNEIPYRKNPWIPEDSVIWIEE